MNWSRYMAFRWLAGSLLLLMGALPPAAIAHGDLELRIAAATRAIEATVEASKDLGTLYLSRGELHREHKDWEAAALDYDRAAKLNSDLVVDFPRAQLLADQNQLEAARSLFDAVLAKHSAHAETFVGRARVQVRLENPQAAVGDFQRALALIRWPEPELFLELARAQMTLGQAEDAIHSLDQGMKRCGPIVALQNYAVEIELGRKNTREAVSRLDRIIEQTDRKENWLAQRGNILLAEGRTDEARKSLQKALEAIDLLPRPIRQAPPMQKLQSDLHTTLLALKPGQALSAD